MMKISPLEFAAAIIAAVAELPEEPYTRNVRGADLREGDIVVKGTGRNRVKTILKRRVMVSDGGGNIFDRDGATGRACDGVHFVDQTGNVGCWDRYALNTVLSQ